MGLGDNQAMFLKTSICSAGDYLVTIEEKNSATYLRAYTNWRYQVSSLRSRRLTDTIHGKCAFVSVSMS